MAETTSLERSYRFDKGQFTVRRIPGLDDVVILEAAPDTKVTLGRGDVVLRELLLEQFGQGKSVAIDGKNWTYTDSAGFGELVECYETAQEKNLQLALFNPHRNLAGMLSLSKFDVKLAPYRNERDALRSIAHKYSG